MKQSTRARGLDAPDDFYEALIEMHAELNDEQSQLVNARLILLLADIIGDHEVLKQAMEQASDGVSATAMGGF